MLDFAPSAEATRSVALLGPTNTGKTHRAVERMLEHPSGMIGLPLRLLAREVYDRVSARVGEDRVALVTGEEKRVPRRPAYWVCTTEAMPLTQEVDFLAVDEVQLATHDERGHIFTDRLLHARGRAETWFMGAQAMRDMLQRLVPAARHETQPRLSRLSYAGGTKLHKLPPRSAVVAFSIPELYRLAGKLRALRGGAAVVLGALSPRARNAQVAMFQAGEVDYLVATDAIGMGLNLDLGHVAFASLRKFDGQQARALSEQELSQIAGRAGRYLRDGTFGTLLPSELPLEVASRIEQHVFEPIRRVRYRSSALDFSSPEALVDSLSAPPRAAYLSAVPGALDLSSLRALLEDPEVAARARRGPLLELLWRVCEIPDFRQILFEVHLELLRELYLQLCEGPLTDDYLARQTRELGDPSGDVDVLLGRTARLRTWAYVANRPGWVQGGAAWSRKLTQLEDELSDALHRGLVSSFVERRGRGARSAAKRPIPASASPSELDLVTSVDPHHPFARLSKLRAAAPLPEPAPVSRLEALLDAPHESFELLPSGDIVSEGSQLASLWRGSSLAQPQVRLAPLEQLPAGPRSRLQRRLLAFARDAVGRLLEPIEPLRSSERAPLRAIAYQLDRGLGGALKRELAPTLEALTPRDREALNRTEVTPGRLTVFVPSLLRPTALAHRLALVRAFAPTLELPPLGRATLRRRGLEPSLWLALGYVALGERAYRLDLAEKVAERLLEGAPPPQALAGLALPAREWLGVTRAFRAALGVP